MKRHSVSNRCVFLLVLLKLLCTKYVDAGCAVIASNTSPSKTDVDACAAHQAKYSADSCDTACKLSEHTNCNNDAKCEYTCDKSDYISDYTYCENDCSTCVTATGSFETCKNCYCKITEAHPKPSKVALNLCYQHTKNSCCLPVFDWEIDEHYSLLVTAGDRCVQELVKPKLHLRDLFCMVCDPQSPKYIKNGVVRICRSLADEIAPSKFDQCGMLKVEERGMEAKGDDVVVPSLEWADAKTFLNSNQGAKPAFFEDYSVEIIEDNIDCYGHVSLSSTIQISLISVLFFIHLTINLI